MNGLKHFPNYALFTPSQNASLKTISLVLWWMAFLFHRTCLVTVLTLLPPGHWNHLQVNKMANSHSSTPLLITLVKLFPTVWFYVAKNICPCLSPGGFPNTFWCPLPIINANLPFFAFLPPDPLFTDMTLIDWLPPSLRLLVRILFSISWFKMLHFIPSLKVSYHYPQSGNKKGRKQERSIYHKDTLVHL